MGTTSYEGVIVSAIGEFGLAQFLIVLVSKLAKMVTAYAMIMTSLIVAEPKWWLQISSYNTTTQQNTTEKLLKTCPNEVNRSGTIVFDDSVHTIVAEWNLICDFGWVPRTIMTVQMVGAILGPPVVAQFADWFGRKTSMIVTHCIIMGSVLGHGLSPNWQTMIVLAFFLGFGIGGLLVVCNIYYLEFVGTKWRTLTGSLPSWGTGVMFLGGVWYFNPRWRYLCYVNFAAGCPILILLCLSPESIRWLLTHGHTDKGKRTVEQLARLNRRDEPDMEAFEAVLQEDAANERQKKTYTYCTLLQHKSTRWKILIFCFVWFSMSFAYYAIAFGVGTFKGNMGINMFLQGTADLGGSLLVVLVSHLTGRRWSSFLLITVTSVCMFSITISYFLADEETYGTAKMVLALVAKLFIAASFTNIMLFTVETFPTVIRNIAFGLASLLSRTGGALAPQNLALHKIASHLPFTFNGVLQIASALLCLCLVDTYSSELEDHFQEDDEKETLLTNEEKGDEEIEGVTDNDRKSDEPPN